MRTNLTHNRLMRNSKSNGSGCEHPRTIAALAVLLPLLGAGTLHAQPRPTPGQGMCILGVGEGCTSGGGVSGGAGTGAVTGAGTTGGTMVAGYPDYDQVVRYLHQKDIDLYRWWLDRERARYSWNITGLAAEAQRYAEAQTAIRRIQYDSIAALHTYCAQYKQALINGMNNPANLPLRAEWEQAIQRLQQYYRNQYQLYKALDGLPQDKFSHIPQTVLLSPETDPALASWLTWLHSPY